MKRKLDGNDVPQAQSSQATSPSSYKQTSFERLGLDHRLQQAIAREGYTTPTPVQQEVIPLALEGKDVIAKAKTGSGKTVAYILPILESILRQTKDGTASKATTALILVPTRELAHQVARAVTTFAAFCQKEIRHLNVMQKVSEDTIRSLLSNKPDIVISTPTRAFESISSQSLSSQRLTYLVIDEADLVLSYGHDNDLKRISENIPTGVQKILTSATMSDDVTSMKDLFCQDPVILTLDEGKNHSTGLSQYYVRCAEDDKFLFAFVIFKLKLVKGKCIIFVGDTDRSYRLKLFFEQFGVRSCVLNAELPVNTRVHVVEEFNKNVYDIIIASDDHEVVGSNDSSHEAQVLSSSTHDSNIPTRPTQQGPTVNGKKTKDYGVSRGIDFKNVACIINFDLPKTSGSYTHRVGRTARAGQTGVALSFTVPADEYHKSKANSFSGAKNDEHVLTEILAHQKSIGQDMKPYQFNMKQVDAFRYRMNDALRAVTGLAVRQARTQELRRELLQSDKLKQHFEDNPHDLNRLRHDGEIRAVRVQQHLKHVPEYLMPESGAKGIAGTSSVSLASPKSRVYEHGRAKKIRNSRTSNNQRRRNPLRSFSIRRKP